MQRKTFSHTPDEARSVGLAKDCVLSKIYSVIEKMASRLQLKQNEKPTCLLKETHLPVMIKEKQSGNLVSCYFKDIYLHLAQNKLPSNKMAIKNLGSASRKIYITRFIII